MSDRQQTPRLMLLGLRANHRPGRFVVIGGKASALEQRYYIASREMTPEAKAIRAHWAMENKLQWMLNVNFSEDACAVRKDNAPEILSRIRSVVINILSLDTTQPAFTKKKLSKRKKPKFANWDEGIM